MKAFGCPLGELPRVPRKQCKPLKVFWLPLAGELMCTMVPKHVEDEVGRVYIAYPE